MSETENWSIKDMLGGIIGGAALSVVGVMMIIDPNGSDDMSAEGRRGLIKQLMNYIWSIPGGIIVTLVGLLIIGLTVHQIINQRKK